ncbi:MAG: CHAT domain-containing protein [Gammaproteobacteria bacterium]
MSRILIGIRAGAIVSPLTSVALVAVLLAACSTHEQPRVVLAEQCASLDAPHPFAVSLSPQSPGPLRILVRQTGVSTISRLESRSGTAPARIVEASTPVDRFGVVTFAPGIRGDEMLTVTVRSHDASEVSGRVCVSAQRLEPKDVSRLRAERAYAAAGVAQQAGDAPRAFDLYLSAAREFDGIDRKRAAQARHAMATIAYINLRDDEGAYVLATWALADFGASADPGVRSTLIALQAQTLLESQRFQPEVRRARVFELLRAAERLARRSPFGARELPRFDMFRGFAEYRAGNANGAIALFTHAADQCEALRDWECMAGARQNIATLAEEARDYTVALQAFSDALRALPPDLTPKLSADIWGNYGRVQGTAGLFRQSEQSHRMSIRLHSDIDDCDGTRMSIARLGTLLVQVGSIGEGDIYLRRAASLECPALLASAKRESASFSPRGNSGLSRPAIAGSESALIQERSIAGQLGTSEFAPPEAPGASETSEGAACIGMPAPESLTEAGKIAVFNALLGLRDASRLANNDSQARICLSAAHAYANTARTRLRLANAEGATLLERGEPVRAHAAFEQGLAIADQARLSQTQEHRSLAYIGLARSALLENQPAIARRYAARALALGSARADLGQVVEALQLMARSYSAQKSDAPAVSILRIAADLIEQVPIDDLDAEQRATWLATQHAVFAELTTLFAARAGEDESRAWEALQVSERGRARSLRYATNQATDTRATSAGEASSARYHDLMRRIALLAPGVQSGNAPDVSIEALTELARQDRTAPESLIEETLRPQLALLDATLVEYAAGRDSLYAFVIDREHIRLVPLASRHEVTAAASALYEMLRNPESAASDVRAAAADVARLTLWPLTQHISHKRVVFVPDDALHTVPFAVLPWSAAADAPLAVQQVELAIMPTTLFVTRSSADRSSRERTPMLALFGDPVFRTEDWERECLGKRVPISLTTAQRKGASTRGANSLPRLPGSRAEITAIADLARRAVPESDIRVRLGCEATPKALREAAAAGPALLHIATHGYVDAYRPRLSALALTPDAGSNGTAATFGLLDILNMPIKSRLVVLSACDTSRGRLLPGEGVLGPAQAFLQAGASSVVASYWRVSDQETAHFMASFYRHLLTERLTAAAALRRAQLDAAGAGSSHDWAAFALYGWPDTGL